MLDLVVNIVQAIGEMLRGFHPVRYLVSSLYRSYILKQWNSDKTILAFANVFAALLILFSLFIGLWILVSHEFIS